MFQQRSLERGQWKEDGSISGGHLERPSVGFEAKPKVCVSHQNDAYKVPNIWQGVFNHTILGDFYFDVPQFSSTVTWKWYSHASFMGALVDRDEIFDCKIFGKQIKTLYASIVVFY